MQEEPVSSGGLVTTIVPGVQPTTTVATASRASCSASGSSGTVTSSKVPADGCRTTVTSAEAVSRPAATGTEAHHLSHPTRGRQAPRIARRAKYAVIALGTAATAPATSSGADGVARASTQSPVSASHHTTISAVARILRLRSYPFRDGVADQRGVTGQADLGATTSSGRAPAAGGSAAWVGGIVVAGMRRGGQGMSSATGSTRRLSVGREREIYDAVIELLREEGYQGMTLPAVAARARCSTATIYRQWQGKVGLVVAALASRRPWLPADADVDTGSLRGDLQVFVRRLPDVASGETELMAALAHAAIRDADVAKAMREEVAGPVGALIERILERAVARGEIAPDNRAMGYCQHMMMSIAMSRQIIEGVGPDEGYLGGFIDSVLVPALTEGASERRA